MIGIQPPNGQVSILLLFGLVACVPAAIPRDIATLTPSYACGDGKPMRVHFYDVSQGLAALVDLPDGRHILVDTGDEPNRAGCGTVCSAADDHLLTQLARDLNGAPISLLWITHQHSDHVGGAIPVLGSNQVEVFVDNGLDLHKSEVARTHDAARAAGAHLVIIDPANSTSPIPSTATIKITPVVPPAWPSACHHDPNDCSIGLRIDYCSSSVLFTGDAEKEEEAALTGGGPVTLLQVAHHGSGTSTTADFIAATKPRYAVISVGKPGEGMNRTYCHPRAPTVERLVAALGRTGTSTVRAFDSTVACRGAGAEHWKDVPGSDSLWVSSRDGDVVLTTTGNDIFRRETAHHP